MTRRKATGGFGATAAIAAAVSLALACALCTPMARGQGAPAGPIHLQPGATPEKEPPPSAAQKIRVRTEEVTAPVIVRNRSGEMVLDLIQRDFHIYDNGVEQKIDRFDLGGEPLSIVLAVETSSRVEPLLPAVRKTGIIFSQAVMAQSAEAAVLSFDDTVHTLEKFTTDTDAVQSAINHLQNGPSGIRLYDAMARGILMLQDRAAGRRRVLLVVGESHDKDSGSRLGEVLRAAQLANVTIYTISLSTTAAEMRAQQDDNSSPAPIGPPGTFPVPVPPGQGQVPSIESQVEPGGSGSANLLALAEWLVKTGKNSLTPNSLAVASKATGGLHTNPKKDRSIEKAMDEIGGELHAQYTISYRPPGQEPEGYHQIKVTVDRSGLDVRTRPGYYIAPPEH